MGSEPRSRPLPSSLAQDSAGRCAAAPNSQGFWRHASRLRPGPGHGLAGGAWRLRGDQLVQPARRWMLELVAMLPGSVAAVDLAFAKVTVSVAASLACIVLWLACLIFSCDCLVTSVLCSDGPRKWQAHIVNLEVWLSNRCVIDDDWRYDRQIPSDCPHSNDCPSVDAAAISVSFRASLVRCSGRIILLVK